MENEKFSMPDTEELVRLYADDVLRVCIYWLGDRNRAEDAFQDVFVRVIKKKDTYEGNCPVKFWILTIAKNICRDYLKSTWSSKVESYEQASEELGDSFENEIIQNSDGAPPGDEPCEFTEAPPEGDLWEAVNKLPEQFKEIVLLKYYYELDNSEIAEQLGIPEATVRSRLFRVRTKLKEFKDG